MIWSGIPRNFKLNGIMEFLRGQVVERKENRLFGEVSLAIPLSIWWITWLIMVIVSSAALVLLFGGYARKEVVAGWLKPDQGLVRVVSPQLGMVEAIHVMEGQIVNKNEPMVTLNLDTAFTNGEGVYQIALAELEAQIVEQERQIPLTQQRFTREAREIEGRIESARLELVSLNEQRQVLDERIRAAQDTLKRYDQLVGQGAAPELDVYSQSGVVLDLRQNATQVDQRIQIKEGEISTLRHRLGGLPVNQEAALSELRERLSGSRAQLAQVAGRESIVMKAPVAGRVAALPIASGQSLYPRQLAVALLPEGSRLEAELFLPTRGVGFIREGHTVRLRFDAFPFQRFGAVEGTVQSVSGTIFGPNELPVTLGITEPVYRVLVNLPEQYVEAYGERFPLQTGMTLSAHVILETRKLWELLLDPLRAQI